MPLVVGLLVPFVSAPAGGVVKAHLDSASSTVSTAAIMDGDLDSRKRKRTSHAVGVPDSRYLLKSMD